MQGYLNSFAIRAGGIVFPGTSPVPRLLEGRGMLLVELPLRALFFDEDQEGALDNLSAGILRLFVAPERLRSVPAIVTFTV